VIHLTLITGSDVELLTDVLAGATSGVGQAAIGTMATGAPLSATVKVLGPTLMKQVKDTSSAGSSVLPSRTGTAVVSLQPVLIRPGAAMTVASSSQTSTIQASVVGAGRTSTGTSSATVQPMLPGVHQAVQDIVQQAQAQAARQNSVGFVATSASSFPQQTATAAVGSTSSVTPVTTVQTAADAAAAAAVAAASQNKSSPYVMRLRNQRS